MPPEVIDLLSSTPPPPSVPREPSSLQRFQSSPPAPAEHSNPVHLFSDDIDIGQFKYEDEIGSDQPSKRRRITPEPKAPPKTRSTRNNGNGNALPSRNRNHLFSFSDDIVLSSDGPGPSDPRTQTQTPYKPPAYPIDSDPIVFTSSAPEPSRRSPSPEKNRNQRAQDPLLDSDPDLGNILDAVGKGYCKGKTPWDNIEDFSDPIRIPDSDEVFDLTDEGGFKVPPLRSEFSGRTADLLASLGNTSKSKTSGPGARAKEKSRAQDGVVGVDDDPDELPESLVRKPKKTAAAAKRSTADKEGKAKEREAAKAQRDREKQLEKDRKQKLKEEKAKDMQLAADLAQVNRKVEKKDSTPEMILDLSSSFKDTSVGNQAVEYMRLLGVEYTFFDSSIRNVVKWRRKMKARYNRALGYWEPCEQFIREEEHVLCLLTAQQFVDMVTSTLNSDTPDASSELELHVLRLKSAYPKCTPIYLIEGLTAWMRKNTNSRNRAYQAEFRRNLNEVQGTSSTQTASTSRRRQQNRPETAPIDDDTIEDALLSLQITHNCLIHQTAAPPESAGWLKTFTEHISTVPYRRERMNDNDSAFCMDTGQVKPGENASDAYVRMLQEVSRVTASMAYGIATQYPSVLELVRGMRRSGPGMLEDVKKSANKNGALTDSRVGPAASRRLYKVFMGLDPQSTDI
ncbi:ERCC4 domain-containing protein [Aspergillus oleicola]